MLYRVSIPGGQAPAAMMYRSEDGEFSYHRPDRCVAKAGRPRAIERKGPAGSGAAAGAPEGVPPPSPLT